MFFDATRIMAMREMIVASDENGRRTALAKILPMQRQDRSLQSGSFRSSQLGQEVVMITTSTMPAVRSKSRRS